MTTTAPKQEIVLPPEGTHIARCYRFIHIGTVEEEFQGEPYQANKIQLTFELPEEKHVFKEGDDPKPFVISSEYTMSMNERANLRKLIEGILGKTMTQEEADLFDLEGLVGMSCLLTIKYKTSAKGRKRAEIASASPLMKGQEAREGYNESKILTYSAWNQEYFDTLPKYLKEKMEGSREYLVMRGGKEDKPF